MTPEGGKSRDKSLRSARVLLVEGAVHLGHLHDVMLKYENFRTTGENSNDSRGGIHERSTTKLVVGPKIASEIDIVYSRRLREHPPPP